MNKLNKTILRAACAILCAILLAMSLSACAQDPMIELGEVEIDVNLYEFLLSRMKGSLYKMGYPVEQESFWNTVFSLNGMTYEEYFKTSVLEQTYKYAVSEFLFDKEGLELPSDRLASVDELMGKLVERAGSKTKLNGELSNYGVNYDMLRKIYIMEAKMEYLKEQLYGEKGESISKEERDAYYNDNYVCFKQILLAGYFYACDTEDENDIYSSPVYYTSDKAEKIAYDKEKGHTKQDEFGKNEKDKFGDDVYYLDDGSIAYDKKNGVVKYLLDKDGNKIPVEYGKEKLGELKEEADDIASSGVDAKGFDTLIADYSQSEGDGNIMYLLNSPSYYYSQSTDAGYLDDIASALGKMKVGEMKVIESDYGYHIIYKYENSDSAYNDEKYKDVFDGFYDDLVDYMFDKICDEYEGKVELNGKVWNKALGFADIASNILY